MNNKEIRIKTRLGDLIARGIDNIDYPSICITFKPKELNNDMEFVLVHTDVMNLKDRQNDNNIYMYAYGDYKDEDFTDGYVFDKNEIIKALCGIE